MRVLVLVCFVSACSFSELPKLGSSDANNGDGNGGDGGGSDGTMGTADAQQCFGTGPFTVCLTTLPTQVVTLSDGAMLDTGTSTSCAPTQPPGWTAAGHPSACFVIGTNINISNARIFGARPLVLLATTTVTITGVLDGAGHISTYVLGPGAPSASCGPFLGGGLPTSAGGAGGSFMTRGGGGGYGNGSTGQPGGTPALAEASAPMLLRAGCSGQTGGEGGVNPSPGARGLGGGAIYAVAGSSIMLSATSIINVSGSGGGSPIVGGGGGGGGSGGMLVLYAPSISGSGAKLVANGGSGSTGATNSSNPSPAGRDPDPTSPGTSATGVAGANGTGIGGSGYSTSAAAQPGGNSATGFGGGGGGGGGGYIQSNVAITGAITSPAVSLVP
jgi:hypothetical protein